MTRKGELWRGDIAQHIDDYFMGSLDLDTLLDWAIEHPFFDDRAELSSDEQRVIGNGLGAILQSDPREPAATRITQDQLQGALDVLWGRRQI